MLKQPLLGEETAGLPGEDLVRSEGGRVRGEGGRVRGEDGRVRRGEDEESEG